MAQPDVGLWIADIGVPIFVLAVIIATLFCLPLEKIRIALPIVAQIGAQLAKSIALVRGTHNETVQKAS